MSYAKGMGGQVDFDGTFVTIHRKGFLARSSHGKGDKRIPVSSITAVQWKPAGPFVNGFISFTMGGANEVTSRMGQQSFDAAKDENSVLFQRKQQAAFETLRADVEAAIVARNTPPAQVADGPVAQLSELARLHDSGALSDEEFAQAKAKLLS